jgi:hypothetical protein
MTPRFCGGSSCSIARRALESSGLIALNIKRGCSPAVGQRRRSNIQHCVSRRPQLTRVRGERFTMESNMDARPGEAAAERPNHFGKRTRSSSQVGGIRDYGWRIELTWNRQGCSCRLTDNSGGEATVYLYSQSSELVSAGVLTHIHI